MTEKQANKLGYRVVKLGNKWYYEQKDIAIDLDSLTYPTKQKALKAFESWAYLVLSKKH